MRDAQEACELQGARWWRLPAAPGALAFALALSACAGPSQQPATAAQSPNLAEVPGQPPVTTARVEPQQTVEEPAGNGSQAAYREPTPLETAAPRDPFATGVIISGDSVTTTDRLQGLPLQTAAAPGQLAAIIFFGHGSAELDARDRHVLRDVAALREHRGGSLRIVGHASSRTHNTTPEEHQLANFEMSLKRATAVLEELRRLGVPADAAHAEAVGDAEPVYHEFMPTGEAGNRRVEIFLEN